MLAKRTIFLIMAIILAGAALAQEITFTATVDKNTIPAGSPVKLTITLTNAREQFSTPDMGGLVIMQGPFESSSFNYVNGRMSSSVSRTWSITGTRPGTYTIGPSRVRIGGGVLETDPIVIEVTKGNTAPVDPNVARGQSRDPDLFVTIDLSKTRGYVGEQIMAEYVLYSRYPNIELSKYDLPKLNGFWAEEIDLGDSGWEDRPRTVNGLQYRVAILKKQILFPQRAGDLRIDPLNITCIVNRSFFSRGTAIDVTSNAVEFKARELPPGAPADFTGAVGELQMTVQADRTDVTADEAIELSIKLSGRSNLKLLEAPQVQLPNEFEVYDPKIDDRISINGNGMAGSREFQYLMIPRHEGNYELGPFTYSYFDTRSGEYRTLRSGTIDIAVAAGAATAPGTARFRGQEITMLDQDIRYIRTGDLALRHKDQVLFGSARWLAGMATPAAAFLLFLVWYRGKRAEETDVAGTRRRKADKVARKRLSEAARSLEQDKREEFYAAMHKALNGYLADKFALGVAEVTEENVRRALQEVPDGHALAEEYVGAIALCEMARFAPVEEMPRRVLYEKAVELIGRIERTRRT